MKLAMGNDVNVTHVVRLYTLLLLNAGEKHGYEIMKEIEKITGKEPTASHIYPFLQELEDNNFVTAKKTGARGKKTYSLTEDGKAFVKEQVHSFGEILEAAVAGSIEECAHCDCEIYDGGYEENDSLYCCEHCAAADN